MSDDERPPFLGVPVLYFAAVAFAGLALWADDYRGMVIAAALVLVGSLQARRIR